jgi:hypothetical protein
MSHTYAPTRLLTPAAYVMYFPTRPVRELRSQRRRRMEKIMNPDVHEA